MKEVWRPTLTSEAQKPYSKGGDNIMAEQGQEENSMGVNEATRRIEMAAKIGEEARRQVSAGEFLKKNKDDLNIDVRRVLEEVAKGGETQNAFSDTENKQEKVSGTSGRAKKNPKEFIQNKKIFSKSSLTEESSQKYDSVADLLGKLPEPSIFQKPKTVVPEEAMVYMKEAEELIKSKRAEANLPKGVDFYNLNPVNTAAVNDPELKLLGKRINDNIVAGTMDYQKMKDMALSLEAARKSLPPNSPDRTWAENLYDQIDQELTVQRQLAGEVDWDKIKAELLVATRNGDLKKIEEIVKKNYDFNEHIRVHDLVEVSLSNDAINGNTYGYALEYALESIINVADLTPLGAIPNPTFVQSENIARLIMGTLDLDQDANKEFYKYLKELQERRQLSHELYKSLSTKDAYQKYVGEHLKNDGFDYLENKIVGVSETQILWEKVMGRKIAKTKTVLSQQEFDDSHEEVKKLYKRNARLNVDGTSQKLKKRFVIQKSGQNPIMIERSLREWEIDRAVVVGRSVAHVSGRAITYGTLGDLPSNADELYDSMNAEYVARIVAGRKIMGARFFAGGYTASKEYLKKWVENKEKLAIEKGLVYGDVGKTTTIYGQKVESLVYADTSVPDLKSHGWRNKRIQLKHKEFSKLRADEYTIGDYLDDESSKIDAALGEKSENASLLTPQEQAYLRSLGSLISEESAYLNNERTLRISKRDRIKNIAFSREVENTVLRQNLYLSALSREGSFTPMLKQKIWEKVAGLLPSRIAAFFPEERDRILTNNGTKMSAAEWEELSEKLFMAETDRVRKQAELVKSNNFATAVPLSDCYADNGITAPRDIDYINKIIDLGKNKSKMLCNMIFPQSAFLDDAPGFQWMNLGKETVGRLLVNDYEGFNTANNESQEVVANPTMRLHESAEHLIKATKGYASPLGLTDAQDRMEADVLTRYDLYAMDEFSKWGFHSIKRFLKKSTSLIEKSNLDANLSMDEKEIADDVDFLSQNNVVANDKAKVDYFGMTESERIKKKTKARVREVWFRHLRILAMIFPMIFGEEFLKVISPDLVSGK